MLDRVLVLSGLDPCGGAGIAADIESINQFGVTPLPIVTTLTAQNTQTVGAIQTVDAQLIQKQLEMLADDIQIKVVKIGLLSSVEQIQVIANWLNEQHWVVLDPIIKASTADELLTQTSIHTLKKVLLPKVNLLTPNAAELERLAPGLTEQEAVESLPCEWVLLTTTDISDKMIEHRLYHQGCLFERFSYHKLPGKYHGSGCTLSSAISALIASELDVGAAVKRGLDYTYQTLLSAKQIGKMQYHPNRTTPV
ncbi:bifunctional hydroxymethylpyrimidine kinase/phosphomethylpyrimidine kinase [Candidatus Thioglobus sp.]|uniref:bifunctional hydroxymethylpyrimidine kinase/phosphomethylpyrimidine kinase n=1 Tax=Candidatus Thioglobus sp. TaxID=2026721 RepID=UPI003D12A2F9